MFGTHPRTGKPIRIIKSDAFISRSQKTMIVMNVDTLVSHSERYERVCIGLENYKDIVSRSQDVEALVLMESRLEEIAFVKSKSLHQTKILFISRDIAQRIGQQEFLALGLANVICLEEIHQVFPFVSNHPWNGTQEDALYLVALVLRANIVLGLDPEKLFNDRVIANRKAGITLDIKKERTVPELWFLTQYYRADKGKREKELKKCLEMNLNCPLIDKVILLNETDLTKYLPPDPFNKVKQIVIGKRLTYASTIKWFQENAPPNTICVFANSDIYLDDSWKLLWSIDLRDKFLSLLRYDVQEDGSSKLFGPRPDSQDTWILLSDSLKSRSFDWTSLDFPFGKAGCDNAINVEMLRKKFLVVNPAYSIKTHHLHLSAVRTYDPTDIVDKPMYFYAEPTGINDMKPVHSLNDTIVKKSSASDFERCFTCLNDRTLNTFCTMVEKQETFIYKKNEPNTYVSTPIQIHKYTNVFHTSQGLIYDTKQIYVGNTEEKQKAWSEAKLSPLLPSFAAKKTLNVFLPQRLLKTPESFLLYYISRIFQLKNEVGFGEFWSPNSERILESLQIFNWGSNREVPVLPMTPNGQVWSEETYEYAVNDLLLHAEDISALRDHVLPRWKPTSDLNERWIVVANDFCDSEWLTMLESSHPEKTFECIYSGRTSASRIVERLVGATGLIFMGGPGAEDRWGWNWLLPSGAKILEIQHEMEPDGHGVHMSGACGLTHTILTVPRGQRSFQREDSIRQIGLVFTKNTAPSNDTTSVIPTLWMPSKKATGLFSHPGDSFRELATLWEEKGYVTIAEHPTATSIWLNSVGDCLLYDRPTLQWLQASSPAEQTWKQALFGNPAAFGPNSRSWTFWARRPQLLEEIVASKQTERSFSERDQRLVFYGKIENSIQERRRTGDDWSTACSEFVMPLGDKPYVFTQKEYLERLTYARFGLCLAGYGKKCHREVECMATGAVPIVSSDVDMANYANPPQEGIHYLRVQSPEEALLLTETMEEAQWTAMSLKCREWYQENASVEGSWALTKRLLHM